MKKDTTPPQSTPNLWMPGRDVQYDRYRRFMLLVTLLGISLVFIGMVRTFVVPVLMAAVFAGLFYPLYQWLFRITHGQASLSALLSCLTLLLGIMVPAYIVGWLITQEAVVLYGSIKQWITDVMASDSITLSTLLKDVDWLQKFQLDAFALPVGNIDWQALLQEFLSTLGRMLGTILNVTSRGTLNLLLDVAITFFTMFYFFRDGESLVHRLKYLSPLDERYENALANRFMSVARAAVKGTLLIGVIQGTFGGLTLWLCGVSSPVLWGGVMVILSIIPLMGSWLIMYPAAVVQIAQGNLWTGLIIFLVSIVIVSNIDNILRPRLVGRDANMHDLMIFFSTLGGISMFGVMGFIIGPIIAALFMTLLDFYSTEFKMNLESTPGRHGPEDHSVETADVKHRTTST